MLFLNPQHGLILIDSQAVYKNKDSFGRLPLPVKGHDSASLDYWEAWQQKELEQQAAWNLVSWSPLLGIGLGNYQKHINQFYTSDRLNMSLAANKSPANFMEKDSHSLFMVQTVESGLLGVCLLILLLILPLKQVLKNKLKTESDRALIAGAGAVILVLLLGAFYSSFMVRGIQFFAVLFLMLPGALIQRNNEKTH